MPRQQNQGFTLIELSIVLVIIGLIVGATLVGQDLIAAAKLRSQISQIEQLNTTTNTFRLKYNCLPGDCPNATIFFTASSQPEKVTNGNGDRRIAGVLGTPPLTSWRPFSYGGAEWPNYWDHLAAAGMIELPQFNEFNRPENIPGVAYPFMKLSSKSKSGIAVAWEEAFSYLPSGHHFRLGAIGAAVSSEYIYFSGGISFEDARNIDIKIDDGLPLTGNTLVAATNGTYRIYPYYSAEGTRYCSPADGTNEYYTQISFPQVWNPTYLNGCSLSINAAF